LTVAHGQDRWSGARRSHRPGLLSDPPRDGLMEHDAVAVNAQRRRRVLVAVVAALIAVGAFVLALSYSSQAALSVV
jgi:hypothetical protein